MEQAALSNIVESIVFEKKKPCSVKWLSLHSKTHVLQAEACLEKFAEKNADRLLTLVAVFGFVEEKQVKKRKISIVNKSQLGDTKGKFTSISATKIYCVGPKEMSSSLEIIQQEIIELNYEMLSKTIQANLKDPDKNPIGSNLTLIKPIEGTRSRGVDLSHDVPIPRKKKEQPKTIPRKKKEQAKTEPSKQKKAQPSKFFGKAKKSPAKTKSPSIVGKTKKSPAKAKVPSIFGKAKKPKTEDKAQPKKQTSTEKKVQAAKKPTSLMNMWKAASKKPKSAKKKSKDKQSSKKSMKQVKLFGKKAKQTSLKSKKDSTASQTKKKKSPEKKKKSPVKKKTEAKKLVVVQLDDEDSSEDEEEEEMPDAGNAFSSDEEVLAEMEVQAETMKVKSKKRKRNLIEDDSDDEAGPPKKLTKREQKKKKQRKTQINAAVCFGRLAHSKPKKKTRKVRKQVSDEDGFLVWKEVEVEVEDEQSDGKSEESNRKEKEVKKKAPEKSSKVKKKSIKAFGKKKKSKQGSLMSFFKKS